MIIRFGSKVQFSTNAVCYNDAATWDGDRDHTSSSTMRSLKVVIIMELIPCMPMVITLIMLVCHFAMSWTLFLDHCWVFANSFRQYAHVQYEVRAGLCQPIKKSQTQTVHGARFRMFSRGVFAEDAAVGPKAVREFCLLPEDLKWTVSNWLPTDRSFSRHQISDVSQKRFVRQTHADIGSAYASPISWNRSRQFLLPQCAGNNPNL